MLDDIFEKEKGESSEIVLQRVIKARQTQKERFVALGRPELNTNSQLSADILENAVQLEDSAKDFIIKSSERFNLSARGYHRTLRLARTIADLQNEKNVLKMHVAEALNYRRIMPSKI